MFHRVSVIVYIFLCLVAIVVRTTGLFVLEYDGLADDGPLAGHL